MAIHHANSINTNTDDGHPQKRPKVDDGSTKPEQEAQLNSTAFSSRNLLSSLAPSLKLQHDQSIPYRHAVLRNMFDDNLLRLSRDEIRNNLSFTLKETDIYKVRSLLIPGNILKNLSKPCRLLFRTANTVTSKHLTGDLANLDGLPGREAEKLKHVKRVRDTLYSNEFRQFLHQVTSCGPLSGKQTDMSINNYRQGCHLLNHDDVISTRRVSYILYLTDPDIPWQAADGGSLELYPVDSETRQPQPIPTNEPGYLDGFKIKEEGEKKLKSLGASLDQLKGKSSDNSLWVDIELQSAVQSCSSLTASDLDYLGQFIDRSFLQLADVSKLKARFVRDSHLSLMGFLSYEFSSQVKQAILVNEAEDLLALTKNPPESSLYPIQFHGPKFELGLQDDSWELVGPPHKHRYLTPSNKISATSNNPAKQGLLDLKALFQSSPFLKWLQLITTCIATSHHVTPRRFRPGLDYTLATSNEQPLLELLLSLTPSLGWEDGEVGGWDCYMASSDEDQSDPAVYKAASSSAAAQDEDDSTLLTIHPAWNKLDLVLRDPQVLTFTKYVSYKSPQSKWDIKAAYKFK